MVDNRWLYARKPQYGFKIYDHGYDVVVNGYSIATQVFKQNGALYTSKLFCWLCWEEALDMVSVKLKTVDKYLEFEPFNYCIFDEPSYREHYIKEHVGKPIPAYWRKK
jgi:hypothetical protein